MRIARDSVIYAMDRANAPVLRVEPGAVVTFETMDAFGGQVQEPGQALATLDWSRVNPATGPLYVEGASLRGTSQASVTTPGRERRLLRT